MASSEAATANISAQGLIPLEPSAALGALAEVVANGTGQATVLKANWQRAAKVLGSSRPPILDLVLPSAAGEVTGDSELLKQLMEIPVPQRAGFVTEFLQREVQNFLRLASPPAASSRFLDLGTDSLMAIELRNRLHSQFGGKFTINATAVFDYPTIGGLAEYLVGQLPDADSGWPRQRTRRCRPANVELWRARSACRPHKSTLGRCSAQSLMSNPALTLVGRTRTTNSPGTALRQPNSSARLAPM